MESQSMFLSQLKVIKSRFENIARVSKNYDYSDFDLRSEVSSVMMLAKSAISRITGPESNFAIQANSYEHIATEGLRLVRVIGVLDALLFEIEHDWHSLNEIIHAELFADFLEMASHLQENGYKDAAAVIAGSTLETHLRKLCQKHSLAITYQNAKGETKNKMGEGMNEDLAKASVYQPSMKKLITGYLSIRNDAAHGNYEKYDLMMVRGMILGIESFLVSNPA